MIKWIQTSRLSTKNSLPAAQGSRSLRGGVLASRVVRTSNQRPETRAMAEQPAHTYAYVLITVPRVSRICADYCAPCQLHMC